MSMTLRWAKGCEIANRPRIERGSGPLAILEDKLYWKKTSGTRTRANHDKN